MTTRLATLEDIPSLIEMGRAFHEAKQGKYPFQESDCEHFFQSLVQSPVSAVFIAPKGFICGTLAGAPTNQEYQTAFELFWWSEAKSGAPLREHFERWARSKGCAEVVFSFPEQEKIVGRMLARVGYKPETIAVRKGL